MSACLGLQAKAKAELEEILRQMREEEIKRMLALLEEMVLIQSGSYNKAGVDAMGRCIAQACRSLPVHIETVEQKTLGNHIVVRTHAAEMASRHPRLWFHLRRRLAQGASLTV